MNKYKLIQTNGEEVLEKEYKTLKEIAEDLGIGINLVIKNNKISEGRVENKRAHHCHRDFFNNNKIYNIKKTVKNIK